MDEIIQNAKELSTTLTGILAGVAGAMKVLGYELDPGILQKIDLQSIALVIIGVMFVFKVGPGKK